MTMKDQDVTMKDQDVTMKDTMKDQDLLDPRLIPMYNAIAKVVAQYEKDITDRKISPRDFRIEIRPKDVSGTGFNWQRALAASTPPGEPWTLAEFDLWLYREGDEFLGTRFAHAIQQLGEWDSSTGP